MTPALQKLRMKIEDRERSLVNQPLWHEMPVMDPRRADTWRPLFAVAALAGPEWLERAQNGLGHEPAQEKGQKTRLLLDIKRVFDELNAGEISTDTLIGKLCEGESEWNEMLPQGRPLSGTRLARMLKPHKIAPGRVYLTGRCGGKPVQVRGYARSQFEDTWKTL